MSAETTTTAAPATTAPVASPSKLFVGNLSFGLKEADLTEKFSVYGTVVSSRIISKRGSSLGYGFVEMDSESAAKKAIEALNKTEIDGRAINVELTKERTAEPARATTKPAGKAPAARKPRSRKPRTNGNTGDKPSTPAATTPVADKPATPAASATDKPKKRRTPGAERKPAERKPATPKQPSNNTLYVTNVPFSVTDAQLLELFKEYSPKGAHIVHSRFNKSKGFGFVEFNNSEDQNKALALNKKQVEGREIAVKIALVSAEDSTAAPAAESTTTTTN